WVALFVNLLCISLFLCCKPPFTAPLGGSLSVQCKYGKEDENSVKYWCKEEGLTLCSSKPVRKGRVSIRDNHSLNQFTVTIDELTNSDTGMYKCGMIVRGGSDLMVPVNVTGRLMSPPALILTLRSCAEGLLAVPSLQEAKLQGNQAEGLLGSGTCLVEHPPTRCQRDKQLPDF
uniref:Ig-like domain-containing protein n=1 Tax=Podarcis muralis TaxID=64176 RepID=A0A670JAX3_PODMU